MVTAHLRLARSPRAALSSLMTVITTAVAVPASGAAAQPAPDGDRRASVMVIDFTVAALRDAADWAPLGKGITQILMTELAANPDLRILERERVQAALDELKLASSAMVDPATAARVGKFVGARYMVTGGANISPRNTIRVDVRGVRLETMVQEYAEPMSGKADDVLEIVARIGQQMSKAFDPTPFDAPSGRSSGGAARPTKEGMRLAMLLGNAIDLQDRHDLEGAKALVRQALAIAPDNPSAKALLTTLERGQ